MNNVPGPGFYYDDFLMNGLRKASARPIVEKKPYNAEEELINELFNNKKDEKLEGIIYDFKKEMADNFKRKIMDRIKQKNIPFLSKSERFSLGSYLRPSSYNPSHNKNIARKNQFNNKNKKKQAMKGMKIQNNYITESGTISNDLSYYSSTNNSSTNNINLFYSRP